MNKQTEALKMAIKTLELYNEHVYRTGQANDVIKTCREALEQPAQEPVAEIDFRLEYDCALMVDRSKVTNGQKLYTHPAPCKVLNENIPDKVWQGLSDDEMMEIWCSDEVESTLDFGRAIEAKLKEKNT